jgi:hypothetical protein
MFRRGVALELGFAEQPARRQQTARDQEKSIGQDQAAQTRHEAYDTAADAREAAESLNRETLRCPLDPSAVRRDSQRC